MTMIMKHVGVFCVLAGSSLAASAAGLGLGSSSTPPDTLAASSIAPTVIATPAAQQTKPIQATPVRKQRSFNAYVLRALAAIPPGGGYAVTSSAGAKLSRAIRIADDGSLNLAPAGARPSFCSSATYLVFLSALAEMEKTHAMMLRAEIAKKLMVENQPDGVGVWGRWNANGPGTARFFHELQLGRNFTDIAAAQPGDFLKVWWTDAIGAREKGHSVIFLGTERDQQGGLVVRYWSSNLPKGYGEGRARMSRIKHMVFSRLENPERLQDVVQLPPKDAYLASMLTVNETISAMLGKIGALPVANR